MQYLLREIQRITYKHINLPSNLPLKGLEALSKHPLSCHPQRVCLVSHKVRERGERREKMRAKNRGPYWRMLQIKVRLQIVHKMAYIALQTGEIPI